MNEKVLEEARQIMAGFFKNRRIELKLSQQDVADKTGLARKTINSMEAGLYWLGMKQYLLICEALHIFPTMIEMEADDDIAEALRSNWKPNSKAMSIDEALELKKQRHNRDGQHN